MARSDGVTKKRVTWFRWLITNSSQPYLVKIRDPLQVNHILHDEGAPSIIFSAVLDVGAFIVLRFVKIC